VLTLLALQMLQTPADLQRVQDTLNAVLELQRMPFWHSLEFWLFLLIGSASLVFSILAFVEARQAKQAATEAGRSVKVQTTTIELTEIAQKLDRIQPEIHFNEARDLLSEISRRLRRVTSPFATDPALKASITALREALVGARTSLKAVRPSDPGKEVEVPQTVYLAVEGDFSTISDCVADLLGLLEKETLAFGDEDAGV
jgi:hypothetical protein